MYHPNIRERTYFLCYFKGEKLIKRKEFKHLPLLYYYLRDHLDQIRDYPDNITFAWHKQYEPFSIHPINIDLL